jgi:hypothetical protein
MNGRRMDWDRVNRSKVGVVRYGQLGGPEIGPEEEAELSSYMAERDKAARRKKLPRQFVKAPPSGSKAEMYAAKEKGLWTKGQCVLHQLFGTGHVVAVSDDGVTVRFMPRKRKDPERQWTLSFLEARELKPYP